MANPSKTIFTYEDGRYEIIVHPSAPAVQYYMQKEDRDIWGYVRSCAPCPAVWVMKDDPHAFIHQQHQYYLRGINYNMTVSAARRLLNFMLAFTNGTGFDDESDQRADYFLNRNLEKKLPQFDKVRTTSRSVMTGTEQFSLAQALRDVVFLARTISERRTSFLAAKNALQAVLTRSENVLKVDVFDSRGLPPLKPGYSYPMDISEVDPNAYLYMPETHPEKFMVATIVNRAGEVVQFPLGGLYAWTGDNSPYSFVPYMAHLGYGDVLYPMRFLYKVPLGSPRPRAYREN